MNYSYEINFSTRGAAGHGIQTDIKITGLTESRAKVIAAMGKKAFRSYDIVNEMTGEVEESFYRGTNFRYQYKDVAEVLAEIDHFLYLTKFERKRDGNCRFSFKLELDL